MDELDDHESWFDGFCTLDNPFSDSDYHLNSSQSHHSAADHHHLITDSNLNNSKPHPQTKKQGKIKKMEILRRVPAIGLKLKISPSLLRQISRCSSGSIESNRKTTAAKTKTNNNVAPQVQVFDPQNLKASKMTASILQIGSFNFVSRNEGELVVKFYFSKKQIVWEILRNGLKEKIEIDWSNIIGIQAQSSPASLLQQNQQAETAGPTPRILQLELRHPPKFYKEIEPEPRKHTQWMDGSDFTEGQAYINRRHLVVFPPRVLDKHYDKLLRIEPNLVKLSLNPFPTYNSIHFDPSASSSSSLDHHEFSYLQFGSGNNHRYQIVESIQRQIRFDVDDNHQQTSIFNVAHEVSPRTSTSGKQFLNYEMLSNNMVHLHTQTMETKQQQQQPFDNQRRNIGGLDPYEFSLIDDDHPPQLQLQLLQDHNNKNDDDDMAAIVSAYQQAYLTAQLQHFHGHGEQEQQQHLGYPSLLNSYKAYHMSR